MNFSLHQIFLRFRPVFTFLLLLGIVETGEANDLRVYYIGNSLTVDSKPPHIASTLRRANIEVTYGRHILGGTGLTGIVANPNNPSVETESSFGRWDQALRDYEWDAITLQAYPGGNAIEEVQATRQLIETATTGGRNANCKFYLYFAWPMISDSEGYAERVLTDFRGADQRVFLNRGFLDYWYEEMTALFPNLDIRIVPTGLAYAVMDEKLAEIEVAGYRNTYHLYRDIHHMSLNAQHLSMMMMLCAFTGIHPDEHKYSEGYLSRTDGTFRDLADDVAWYCINADPRTKVSAPRELEVRPLPGRDLCEIIFIGSLEESTDLGATPWNPITGATSPYRFSMDRAQQFFRAR